MIGTHTASKTRGRCAVCPDVIIENKKKGYANIPVDIHNFLRPPGASENSVDLLPTPGLGSEWTSELMTDDGHESDQIYEFDGETNAVVIPDGTLDHNLTTVFTISTWMKHKPNSEPKSAHHKEHIICNADDHGTCSFSTFISVLRQSKHLSQVNNMEKLLFSYNERKSKFWRF